MARVGSLLPQKTLKSMLKIQDYVVHQRRFVVFWALTLKFLLPCSSR
jgi:hypothetical protein